MKKPFRSDPPERSITLKRQPYYCEENAWQLCQEPFFGSRKCHVVFISNLEQAVPMWNQRAGREKPGLNIWGYGSPSAPFAPNPIVWDYHVIVLAEDPVEIWDVDTLLGIPIDLFDYLQGSFHPEMPEQFQPCFRIVHADVFVDIFASDRSHMQRPDGSFRKPPPTWPMIGKRGVKSNLMQFVDMAQTFVGEVLSLEELRKRFG